MLALLLSAGNETYGLDVRDVREVAPCVELKAVPHAPSYVSGLFSYRGSIVPVIDLSHVIGGVPSQLRLSTRIVVVHVDSDERGEQLVGLLAERVTDTISIDQTELQSPGLHVQETPYLGQITSDGETMIQLVRVENLLTPELRELLLSAESEASS